MSIEDIIGRAERLYEDLDLNYVAEFKARTGQKAIGFLPVYVPREVIHAAGALPVGIMGGGDQVEIVRGDAFYQSYICHIPRSVVELGLDGRLDALDGMLFPAICDVIRNLSGMWQLLFADKYAKYVDFPQNFAPEVGGKFYRMEVRGIYHDICALTGIAPSDDALRRSIGLYNDNRRAVDELYALRARAPHLVPSDELYLLMRAGNLLEVEEHTAMLDRFLELAPSRGRQPLDNIKVVATGLFCEQPPLGLIRSLEQAGCYILDDDWVLVARGLKGPIPTEGDPLEAIADAYVFDGVPTPFRYIGDEKKGADLVARAQAADADGVIFAAPSFCDPGLLDRPMLQDALEEAGIPHTSFLYAENAGQFQAIREQTGAFSDSIKLWGAA